MLFNTMAWLHTERKSLTFVLIHFICTMIIWAHFFYEKFKKQEDGVPDHANKYWYKRLIPSLEFGAMHAILFQCALIPLTM